MNICAIDQSLTSTGVTIFDISTEEILYMGLIKTTPRDKFSGVENSEEERIFSIRKDLIKLIDKYDCKFAFMEGLSFNNRNSISARILAGIYYTMLTTFMDRFLSYQTFPPTTVKAFAVKGNASKEEMFEALPEEVKNRINEMNAKKTTGMFDLTDSYFIGKLAIKLIKEEKIQLS